ncbi:MAG: hypothetical protein ABIJ41_06645 [Candidatus Omnitrophota bacterium]
MSKQEEKLYPDIEEWLKVYLTEKYSTNKIITTRKTSRQNLDVCLKSLGIEIKEAIGLSIKVDIVGILVRGQKVRLVFVEVKDGPLTLKDLGQLWGYTQLLNPAESFLISSKGLGSLERIFKIYKREDLLRYGPGHSSMMKVCKWNPRSRSIDYGSLIPKL